MTYEVKTYSSGLIENHSLDPTDDTRRQRHLYPLSFPKRGQNSCKKATKERLTF